MFQSSSPPSTPIPFSVIFVAFIYRVNIFVSWRICFGTHSSTPMLSTIDPFHYIWQEKHHWRQSLQNHDVCRGSGKLMAGAHDVLMYTVVWTQEVNCACYVNDKIMMFLLHTIQSKLTICFSMKMSFIYMYYKDLHNTDMIHQACIVKLHDKRSLIM